MVETKSDPGREADLLPRRRPDPRAPASDPAAAIQSLRLSRQESDSVASDLMSRAAEYLGRPVYGADVSDLRDSWWRFEVVDFDILTDGRTVTDMGSALSLDERRELTGFLRLTRPEVWRSYTEDYTRAFLQGDLGHRSDDLWMVIGPRLFRRHPEHDRADVQRYLADVELVALCAMAAKADLDSIGRVLQSELSSLNSADIPIGSHREWTQTRLREGNDLAGLLLASSSILNAEEHDFFADLTGKISVAIQYQQTRSQVEQQVDRYYSCVQAILSDSALAFSETLSTRSSRLSSNMLWLTAAVLILTLVQTVSVIVQLVHHSHP